MSFESTEEDKGVAAALVQRLEQERLPRAFDLKEKVDAGGRLDDMDIAFLERVFADMEDVKQLVARSPEYHQLAAKVVGLYEEITAKALENEKSV
jgi:hypothetical protein